MSAAPTRRPAPRRRRIAVVSDAVHPWNTGGKETRLHELTTRLAARGVDVDVYTMKWWDTPGPVTWNGVRYHAICRFRPLYRGKRRSIWQSIVFALATLRILTRRFDVLEADMVPILQLFPLRLVAFLRRVPLVVTWHEYWGLRYWVRYLGVAGLLAAAVERLAAGLPDVVVAASPGTAARLGSAAGPGGPDLHVVPGGIDARRLARAAREPAPVSADLVVAGRLLPHKNVDVALRALARLRAGGRPLTMAIIGVGPEEARLRRLAHDLKLDDAVRFCGVLPRHEDVLATIAGARALVFPSVREGFGLVALEATALHTPVVTADHPDNLARELVEPGRTGELAAPGDPDSLADAVRRALALGPVDEDGAVAARFDWDTLARRLEDIYDRVA